MRIKRQFVAALAAALVMVSVGFVGTASAGATVDKTTQDYYEINTCNGEAVTLLLELHIITRQQPNGTTSVHIVAHGTGVGSDWNQYILNGQQTETFSSSTYTFTLKEVLVSLGSAPNQALLITSSSSSQNTVQTVCPSGS